MLETWFKARDMQIQIGFPFFFISYSFKINKIFNNLKKKNINKKCDLNNYFVKNSKEKFFYLIVDESWHRWFFLYFLVNFFLQENYRSIDLCHAIEIQNIG